MGCRFGSAPVWISGFYTLLTFPIGPCTDGLRRERAFRMAHS